MLKAILLPVDLAAIEGSRRALEFAIQLARTNSSTIHVVSVLPNFGMSIVGSYFDKAFEKKALADMETKIRAFCQAEIPGDVDARPHVAHGSIYDEIMRAAEKLDCDTIVMAAHRPELRDYLLGPNAARVVRHARQSVFVVRD